MHARTRTRKLYQSGAIHPFGVLIDALQTLALPHSLLPPTTMVQTYPDTVTSTNRWGHGQRVLAISAAPAHAIAPTVVLQLGGSTTSPVLCFLPALALTLELGPAKRTEYTTRGGGQVLMSVIVSPLQYEVYVGLAPSGVRTPDPHPA